MQNSPDDKCRKVYPDPELQKWHKQFKIWDEWTKSEEYAKAFLIYYKAGSVPINRYPPCLVRKDENKGTIKFAHLEGIHEWRDFQDEDFLSTAIYNEQLARWKKKFEKAQSLPNSSFVKRRYNTDYVQLLLSFPIIQIAGWALTVILLVNMLYGVPYGIDRVFYGMGFSLATVLLLASLFLARWPITRFLNIQGFVCNLIVTIGLFGIYDESWVAYPLLFLICVAIPFTAVATIIWIFLRFLENGVSIFKR